MKIKHTKNSPNYWPIQFLNAINSHKIFFVFNSILGISYKIKFEDFLGYYKLLSLDFITCYNFKDLAFFFT